MFVFKWILNLLKFVVREISSLMIKLVFLVIIFIIIINNYEKSDKKLKTDNTYLIIDTSKKYNENLVKNTFNFGSKNTNFYQLLTKIKLAGKDSNVTGIVMFIDNNTLSKAQISELGDVLTEFKLSKKPVYSYCAIMDNNSLLLSSYASESFMPPSTSTMVNITGYNKDIPYYKKLTEKIGVNVDVIHVGDFKTYGENYTRDEMSLENRTNLKRILNKSYLYFIKDLSENLSLDVNSLNHSILSGKLMGESSSVLKKDKLITSLEYLENLKKIKMIDTITDIDDYNPETKVYADKIAVVYLDGEIAYTSSKNPRSTGITPDKVIPVLENVAKNHKIKGIILRINSPGGSALASDIIYNSVKNIEKPVYVSIGDVAASGGYYIASGANKIFADRNSITGSIGVVSLIPNIKELTNKLGVNMNDISLGEYSDLYSLTSPMTDERKKKIYDSNLKVYEEFLNVVATGRKMPVEEVAKIAQGQVWLGEEALENGLVDSIGGLNDTISAMASNLKIEDKYSVVEIPYKEDFKSVFESFLFSTKIFKNMFFIKHIFDNNLNELIESEDIFFKPMLYTEF